VVLRAPVRKRYAVWRGLALMKKSENIDAKTVESFGRFAASGYKRTLFTKELYRDLSRTFEFIAHFDIDGFYNVRFSGPAERVDTFAIMVDEEQQRRTLTDLEQQLRSVVVTMGLYGAAANQLADETERTERAELARLKAKYEMDERLS